MALEDILEKIKKETDEKLAKLEKEFSDKKKKLEEDDEKRRREIDANLNDKIEEKSAKILEKAETLADRESKNKLLEAKRALIEDYLDKAIKQLSESANYGDMLAEILKKANIEGDAVVIAASGKETVTKEAIKTSGKSYFLSDKSENIQGGLIVKTDKVEINNSFETIIKEQLREDLEIQLHKILF